MLLRTSILSLSTLLLGITPSLGAPLSKSSSLSRRANDPFTSGAIYFQTNEDQNFIVAASINPDGTVNLANAVTTNGRGARGKTNPADQANALFSQGSVQVSTNAKVLAVVNAGSNTISTFTIDAQNPTTISQLGVPVSAGGDFPVSLAFNANGDRLCVLNGGSAASVNCYSVDQKQGLSALPNTLRALPLGLSAPPNGPQGTASQLVFAPDGNRLFASVKGTPGDDNKKGFLAVWNVDKDGKLSDAFQRVAPPNGGNSPAGMVLVPNKNAALVADPTAGAEVFDLGGTGKDAQVTAGGASGVLKIDGQSQTAWISRSEKTKNFYLTDVKTAKVTEVAVGDDLKASVVKQYQLEANSSPIDSAIVAVGDKDFMYVLSADAKKIQVMSLEKAGDAKNVQTLEMAAVAQRTSLQISNRMQGMAAFVKPK